MVRGGEGVGPAPGKLPCSWPRLQDKAANPRPATRTQTNHTRGARMGRASLPGKKAKGRAAAFIPVRVDQAVRLRIGEEFPPLLIPRKWEKEQ